MDFSDNLHRLMDERGVSTITLGRALNVSDESVSNWRKGKSLPKLDVALRIAKYFDVSLTDLAGLTVTNPRGEQATFIRIPVLGDVSAGALEIASLLTGRYLTINEVLLDGYPVRNALPFWSMVNPWSRNFLTGPSSLFISNSNALTAITSSFSTRRPGRILSKNM